MKQEVGAGSSSAGPPLRKADRQAGHQPQEPVGQRARLPFLLFPAIPLHQNRWHRRQGHLVSAVTPFLIFGVFVLLKKMFLAREEGGGRKSFLRLVAKKGLPLLRLGGESRKRVSG